jgi:pimeloyl-ACP methyl ester carboxylesterase
LRPENIWTFIQALASPDPFKKEEKIFSVIINNQDKHRDLIQSWGTITRDMPVSIPNTFRQLWAAINAPVPDKPKIPVVIGVSENDRMVSSNCSKNMAKGWELPLEVNPTAGHDIINDDIDWVYQLIKENFILDDNQAKASISSTRL